MDKETSKEQIKEFWEWCGVKPEEKLVYDIDGTPYIDHNWLPPIDLNNLFKWAVPKLIKSGIRISLRVNDSKDGGSWVEIFNDRSQNVYYDCRDKDPAQALYQAIQEVRNAK